MIFLLTQKKFNNLFLWIFCFWISYSNILMGLINLYVTPYRILLFLNYITWCRYLKWYFIRRLNIIWFFIWIFWIFFIIFFRFFLLIYLLYFVDYFTESHLCFFIDFLWYPSYYILLTQYSVGLASTKWKFTVSLSFHVYLFQLLRRFYILNNIWNLLFSWRAIQS